MNQSREAHHPARPLHSPEGASLAGGGRYRRVFAAVAGTARALAVGLYAVQAAYACTEVGSGALS